MVGVRPKGFLRARRHVSARALGASLLFIVSTVVVSVFRDANTTDAVSASPSLVCSGGVCSWTFTYTGDYYEWTVPAGVTQVGFSFDGAQGGHGGASGDRRGNGGLGGRVTGKLTVTPGATYRVYVGGQGTSHSLNGAGGFNGGGSTSATSDDNRRPGAGGGASDIRTTSALSSRVVVAGGGGGASGWMAASGGAGGGLIGQDGQGPFWCNQSQSARGGTQVSGGTSGPCWTGNAGTLGVGGNGLGNSHGGGGGGGGYYGGGGAVIDTGGGGSSFTHATLATEVVHTQGSRSGNGVVVISLLNPSVTYTTSTSSPSNVTTLTYQLAFSEAVTGFTESDLSLSGTSSGWTLQSLTGSGQNYTAILSSASPSSGSVVLTLATQSVTGTVTGQLGPTSATSTTMSIDVDPPTASFSSQPASPAAAMSLTFGLSFNESVTGLGAADFSNSGTALGCVFTPSSSSGTSMNVVVTQCQEGTLQLVLQSGAVLDAAGNTGPVTSMSSSVITLAAQPLTLTATDHSINFGGSFTEAYSQSGLIGGDSITSVSYSYSGTTTLGASYGPSTTKPTQGGTYSIVLTPSLAAGNINRYSLTRINGTLTISRVAQSPLSIASTSATYGQTLSLTSSGGLGSGAVSFIVVSGTCSLVGSTLTVGTVGSSCVVQATKAGDDNYTPVSSVATSITIGKAQQAPLALTSTSATYGQTLSLASSGGSGTGAVSFTVVSGTCTLNGASSLNVGNVGSSCVVKATKAADNNYFEVSSTNTTITIGRATQSGLSITSGSSLTTGDSLTLTATGGQSTGGLSWLLNNGDCSLAGAVLTSARGGFTCVVQVTRAGDANYNSITVTETINVNKIVQVLSFNSSAPVNVQVGDTYTTSVTSSAFLAPLVTIANSSSSVCSISAGVVTFNAVGTCLVSASQAGNDVYSSAAASQSITVGAVPVAAPQQETTTTPSVTPRADTPRVPAAFPQSVTPATTTTTTTTTTTLPPSAGDPVLSEDGTPIELEEGETTAYVQGEIVQVRKQSLNGTLILTLPNNVSMGIGVLPGSNTPTVLSADGELRVFQKDAFMVSADGLLPGSTYTVFMFSEPRELARGEASIDGAVTSGVVTPDDIESGQHTLQLNGVGPEGEVVSISFGFTVLSREDNTLVAILAISAAVLLALLGGRPIWRRRNRLSERF